MSTPSNPLLPDAEFPEEIPEELRGIAQRLQAAINEVFDGNVESDEPATSAQLSEKDDRDSAPVVDGAPSDRRLYFPDADGWKLGVKSGAREYCSRRNPGEEWFHLLLEGELFLEFGVEKVCLNCAFRSGLLTDDREFWQKGHRRQRIATSSDTAPEISAAVESPVDFSDQNLTSESDLENPTERQA